MGYEVYKDKAGEYRFRYRSRFNGEIQVTSEGYTTRTDAYRGINDFVRAQLHDVAADLTLDNDSVPELDPPDDDFQAGAI